MQPAYFSLYEPSNPIYYSLQYPTTPSFSNKSKPLDTKINEIENVKYFLDKYIDEILVNKLNVHNTSLEKIAIELNFDFFHNSTSFSKDVKNSNEIFQEDLSFLKAAGSYKEKELPIYSKFFNGCVRISK